MKQMTPAAVERVMKLQDVILRAMARRITWFQAAEIPGITCRQMQCWHTRFEQSAIENWRIAIENDPLADVRSAWIANPST